VDEPQWQTACWPTTLLAAMRGRASIRKLRLFAVACCRRVWQLIFDPTIRCAVEVAERFADGLATESEREAVACRAGRTPVFHMFAPPPPRPPEALVAPDQHAAWAAVYAYASGYTSEEPDAHAATAAGQAALAVRAQRSGVRGLGSIDDSLIPDAHECAAQAHLMRDIFGNPFHLIVIDPSWLAWREGVVARLATAIYEERRFAEMPILADALEDAGCTESSILAHCREGKAHVRGCWVVDLLLSKS
jgi:hypothetical protein